MYDGDDYVDMVTNVCVDDDTVREPHDGSIAGSPPSADDDRRVGPAVNDQHKQGGPTKSKPGNGNIDSNGANSLLSFGRHDRFIDDITGQPLPPDLCMKARAEELAYFKAKDVWILRSVN